MPDTKLVALQCGECGAPTKDGRYHNDALLDETARRVEAEKKLRNARAQLIRELRASLHGTGQEMHRYGNAMLDAFEKEQETK